MIHSLALLLLLQSPSGAAMGQAPPNPTMTPVPPAGFVGNEPRGLFYRLLAGGGSRMETRTRIFLPNRRLVRVEPFGSGDEIDLARCSGDTCGSYRMEGNMLVVRWDNGNTERLTFARAGEGFTLDGDAFQPARGLSPAEAAGNWGEPGGVDAIMRLRSDGNFEWGAGSAATTLRGRYSLKGLTLELNFSDGTSKRYALFAAGRSRPAGLISLDGTVYSRR